MIVLIPKNPNDSVQLRSGVDFREENIYENLFANTVLYWWRKAIEKELMEVVDE